MQNIEILLGEYWDIAFKECASGESLGDEAGRVLSEIRAEFDRQKERADSNQGMADCMDMVRSELIAADIIAKDVAPMFVPEAIMRYGKAKYQAGRIAAHRMVQEQAVSTIQTLQAERDHWKANHADMVKRAALLSQRDDLPVDRLPAYREMEALQKTIQAKQAEIDRLMLEFCPDEMTPEQMAEWERHQRGVPE